MIGVCSPPSEHISGTEPVQDHNAIARAQHGSAIAMDGCQECLRESRCDRVMSHDKRTGPEASTWHVQFLLSL